MEGLYLQAQGTVPALGECLTVGKKRVNVTANEMTLAPHDLPSKSCQVRVCGDLSQSNNVVKSLPLFPPSRPVRDGFHVHTVQAVCQRQHDRTGKIL